MQKFWDTVDKISPLTNEGKAELKQICTLRHLKKNDFVLRHKAVCDGFYYIHKGMVRIFYYKHEKEITEWFALENSFCFSIISFFKKTPSELIIQCLEDTELITISRDGLYRLSDYSIEISRFFREMLAGSLIASQNRMDSMLFETARQRYENLITIYPSIVRRAPLQYIASYLGIKAETLSRIRTQWH